MKHAASSNLDEMNDKLQTTPELPVTTRQGGALAVRVEDDPLRYTAAMLQMALEKGVTAENAGAVEKMIGLVERLQDKKAEREFAAAFTALQAEMPAIKALTPVPDKHGGVRYKYAPADQIMAQLKPLLTKHGFSVSWDSEALEGKITMVCVVRHASGHERRNRFTCRIGSGPYGANETQADGAAGTSAQRYALCDAFDIAIRKDDDVRNIGAPITPEQADELERRVKMTNSDQAAFLRFAGAKTFREITSVKYPILDASLRKKEQGT